MNLNLNSQSIYYIVAATATFCGLAYKVGSVVFRNAKKQIGSLQEDRAMLRVVFKEVTPNHGTSIKDQISSLDKSIVRNNELTEKIFHRQRWLMENHKSAVFEATSDGLFAWVNEEFAHFFGKSAVLFVGNGWKNIVHQDDRHRVEEHWNSCVRDKIDIEICFKAYTSSKDVITVKLIANKSESGYIGSITVKKRTD